MQLTQIKFNGKKSLDDMGITINSRKIDIAEKVKTTAKVPYSNVTYDFSNVYGDQVYNDISLQYVFNVIAKSQDDFYKKCKEISNWLMAGGKSDLYDDVIAGYYYYAECLKCEMSIYDSLRTGTLTANFTAYPFRISEIVELELWDDFSFTDGFLNETLFQNNTNVSQSYVYDNHFESKIQPVITLVGCTSLSVVLNGKQFTINRNGKTSGFVFRIGKNNIIINGKGGFKVECRTEVL